MDSVLAINRGFSFSSFTTPMPSLLRPYVRPAIALFRLFEPSVLS
jgi:hypothetical protein